jgi:hypothetical protein
LSKVLVAQHKRHGSLLALGRNALADRAGFLQVNVPRIGVARSVLERKGEDSSALFDGVFAVGVGGGEGARDFVKGGRGGEGFWVGDVSYVWKEWKQKRIRFGSLCAVGLEIGAVKQAGARDAPR